ncbi:MAG: FAD-dependent oxidoreductase [Rhodospirillales bacterium]|nr:FAD-dependent oxidoreductase [Rhodospirillales bacterium]
MADQPNILVVGAGIIGASIAWHLAGRGARVTVIDAGEPGGVATRNSWAWINASWGNPEPYFRLRVHGMEEWRRLERALPTVRVAWTGSLNWELPADRLEAFVAQHAAWGYDVRCVDRAQAARIEPNLADPPGLAVHAPREGAVEPLDVTRQLLSAARERGVTLVAGRIARSIDVHAGRITGVGPDAGHLAADMVVVAAGAGAAELVATAGPVLPVSAPPAVLAATKPLPRLLNGLIMTPDLQLRQTADGRLVAAASADAAVDVLATMRALFRPNVTMDLDFQVAGRRPIPNDRLPLVGRAVGLDGLYVAVTHSGVTLAPAVGSMVAEEIVAGRRHPLLEPFGLARP